MMRCRIAELTEAVEARDGFIAIAAHELRNPMMPIMGQIELLLKAVTAGQCAPRQVAQRLDHIQGSIHHYMKRANVLLDISRINNGTLRLEIAPCDIAIVLRDIAGEFAAMALQAGISITVATPVSLPGSWDRLALEQIIDNLVSNAIKYGSRTPIELSAELRDEGVCIMVCDHGAGIAADERERVFGKFERAVGRRKGQSGFGVGLWIVRQLTGAMGGAVEIGDTPGGGASFTVTLPRSVGKDGS